MSTLTRPPLVSVNLFPNVGFDPASDAHVLREDWCYRDETHGVTICIPKGYVFDHASVPRLAWWAIAPHELSDAAPLLHDRGYERQGRLCPERTYTRAEVDDLFRRVMAEAGVPRWRRVIAWGAVRAFGGRAWRS